MHEYNYYIAIKQTKIENGTKIEPKIKGKLICEFCEYETYEDFLPENKNLELNFNPSTILGDLRYKEQPYEYRTKRTDIDRPWELLMGLYEYEYGFDRPLYIGNDKQYLQIVSSLDKTMRNNQCRTLHDLKEIQEQYHLNLDCHVSIEENDIYFELLQKKKGHTTQKTYNSLEYNFGDLNEELEHHTYMNRNHQFSYYCHTMADVIFAILHFLVIHQYKFKTCTLCQKRYAQIPKQGQGKYCSRMSPLGLNSYFDDELNQKLKGLNCRASMKKYYEVMRNRKKNKVRYQKDNNLTNSFLDEFDKYNDNLKKSHDINDFVKLYSFVEQYKFPSN